MIADEQLREALEVAFGAMQVLARQEPSFEIPRPLQPLLRFKKLTKTALATVRQVLEDNEAIRVAIGEALRAQGLRTYAALPGEVLRYVEEGKQAKPSGTDPFQQVWNEVDKAVSAILDHTTFAELARRWKQSQTRYVANWDI